MKFNLFLFILMISVSNAEAFNWYSCDQKVTQWRAYDQSNSSLSGIGGIFRKLKVDGKTQLDPICTVTLLEDQTLMTAGHCFVAIENAAFLLERRDMVVKFKADQNSKEVEREIDYSTLRVFNVPGQSGDTDVAFFRLKKPLPKEIKPVKLPEEANAETTVRGLVDSKKVHLLAYFNPLLNSSSIESGCSVHEIHDVNGRSGTAFSHDCGTVKRMSGSPLFVRNSNGEVQVVGLHRMSLTKSTEAPLNTFNNDVANIAVSGHRLSSLHESYSKSLNQKNQSDSIPSSSSGSGGQGSQR